MGLLLFVIFILYYFFGGGGKWELNVRVCEFVVQAISPSDLYRGRRGIDFDVRVKDPKLAPVPGTWGVL